MKCWPLVWLLLIAQTARADALLDSIFGWNRNEVRETKCKKDSDWDDDRYEDHSLDNGEHYSWDDIYIDPYENTEIIIDPYQDLDPEPKEDDDED